VINIDYTGKTKEMVDSGGRPVPGWYLVRVKDVKTDPAKPGQYHMDYEILQACINGKVTNAFNGLKLQETIMDPANATTDKARETIEKKVMNRAARFGLWDGQSARLSADFTAVRGYQYAIKAVLGKAREGGEFAGIRFVEPDFAGVYPLSREEVPACWRQTGAAPAPAAPAPAAPAQQPPGNMFNQAPAAPAPRPAAPVPAPQPAAPAPRPAATGDRWGGI
jgi:hypothetical protein